ncbi:serine hydrolase [Thiorhodococcus fuscus]|uniref:Serine hydrolase n=1 Tax=Thiorhodococcus fuscus TaxID=527200 RepID=A0ABW4YCV6_9GAMM
MNGTHDTRTALATALTLAMCGGAEAQDVEALSRYLDITQDALVGQHGFYGVVSGMEFGNGGRWTHATGTTGPATASEGGRALTVDDRFHIGSQTKTYTGTVVLQFVGEGVIGLDDTLQEWYVRQPAATQALSVMSQQQRETFTVRDLISMRTGIAEYLSGDDPNHPGATILDTWNAKNGDYDLARAQLIAAALAEGSTMTPGDQSTFQYSNTNFTLAGIIAEAASCETGHCRTIAELITERVVEPLGLTNTLYPTGTEWGSDQHTNGTWNAYGELTDFTFTTPSVPNSAGAMISNIHDQLDWLIELTTNRNGTLDPAVFAERLRNTDIMNGEVGIIAGGYGFAIYGQHSTETGVFMLGHGGELSGYQTLMFHFPGDPSTTADDLFIVSDLNTFLSLPGERQYTPADINDYFYDLQETVAIFDAFVMDPNGCSTSDSGTVCRGTTVADQLRDMTTAFTVRPSGYRWVSPEIGFDAPVPTYVFYGQDTTATRMTNGSIRIEDQGILKGYGNDLTLIRLEGTENSVQVDGEIETIGANTIAIDASAPSNDTIGIGPTGRVSGGIDITQGSDRLTVNGILTGDVSTGAASRLSGNGRIDGRVSGSGTITPGDRATLGTLTVTRYEAADGVLEIDVDRASSRADLLSVVGQTATIENYPVADTGVAILGNGTLRLKGTAPQGDVQLPILTAANGVSGRFARVEDPDGMLLDSGRTALDVLSSSSAVTLTSTSPAIFDGAAETAYRSSLAVMDSILEFARTTSIVPQDRLSGFVVSALGDEFSFDDADGVSGYDIRIGGMLAGLSGSIGNRGVWALSLAKTSEKAKIDETHREQQLDATMIGITAELDLDLVDLGLGITYGFGDIDYQRDLGGATATGETDHERWILGMEVSRTRVVRGWNWNWLANLTYMRGSEAAFTETSGQGIPARFGGRTYERLRLGIGATASVTPTLKRVAPSLSLDLFQHLDLDNSDIAYTYGDGSHGTLEGRSADGPEVRMTAGLSYALTKNAMLKAALYVSAGDDYSNVGFTSGVDFAF